MGLASTFSWGLSKLGLGSGAGGIPAPPSATQIAGILGPPRSVDVTRDQIIQDLWIAPYRGPSDFDRDTGGETPQSRRDYRRHYMQTAVTKSAVQGKVDDISCLKLTFLSGDKNDARANLAAEFCDWTIANSPRGSRGLIDTILRPAIIDGWSIAEKKLELVRWKGRQLWGLAHIRSLDSTMIRLQTDQYRNLLSVVNFVRGIEYFSPDQVVLYSHNPLFGNPFGLSDIRAATRAANIIEDVYKLWYLALRLYGLPFMQGKAKTQTGKKALAQALQALREGGYCTTDEGDEIVVLDLAAAAATDGFERMVHTMREDNFFAIRGVSLPFLEGDGGQDAHGDTDVQQDTSDSNAKASSLDVCDVIRRQVVPWIVCPNFGDDCPMPLVKLGGINWQHAQTIVQIVGDAKERCGAEVSSDWFHDETGIPTPRDDTDRLLTAQERQAQQQTNAQALQPAAQPGMLQPGQEQAVGTEQQPVPAEPEPDQGTAFSDDVKWVATSRLVADPARFQFRRGHDPESGVTRPLPDEMFDAAKCPPLATWVDDQGEENVVDGHHRLAWAERDGAKRLPVHRIQAKNAAEAKAIGERLNREQSHSVASFAAATPAPSNTPPTKDRIADAKRRFLAGKGLAV